ncbi:MAG: hypothetical protein JRI68_15795 [Deltaproteobacteria bacterium]|nr:hypothetical protein [Deltaproteobacteria bacterium]
MPRSLPILLLACLLGLWLSPAGAQPDKDAKTITISEEARKQFGIGVGLLEDPAGPRYQEAYEAFHRAYAESPTVKILSNIALCAMMLERDGEAKESISRYLEEMPEVDPRERAKLEQDLKTLDARMAHVELTFKPAAVVVTDRRTPLNGDPVTNRYELTGGKATLGIYAGKHRIEVAAEGHEGMTWQVQLEPGDKKTRKLTLKKKGGAAAATPKPTSEPTTTPPTTPDEPVGQDGGGISTGAIVGLIATGALAVGAGVVGGLAMKAKADYESYETGGKRQDAEAIRGTGETLNIVTDVLIGSAVLAAGVTTVLLIIGSGDEKPESTAGRFRLVPTVGQTGVGAVVEARF